MKVEILDEARGDLVDGYRFYEKQEEGLGTYFLDSLLADLESLRFYGGIHGRHFGFHRALARRFPFAIYYLVRSETVRVYAVLDCRRSPSWTRRRLS